MQRHQEGFTEPEFEANANKTIPHTLTMGRTIILSRLRKKTPNHKHTSHINYGNDDYTVTIKEKDT